mgnify:CR=1 FL=1
MIKVYFALYNRQDRKKETKMSYILHMSDFHFGKFPETEIARLDSLAQWILNLAFDIRYLVFTGDVIDARVITESCIQKLVSIYPDEFNDVITQDIHEQTDTYLQHIKKIGDDYVKKYNSLLKEQTHQQILNAITLMQKFLCTINVCTDHFIACCGNHDRLRYLSLTEDEFSCNSMHEINEEDYTKDYEPYIMFCKGINPKLTYNTALYFTDDLFFVISNSNWRTPKDDLTNNACIHCGKIMKIFKELETMNGYHRNKTVFLSHKPFDDFCEDAKFPYKTTQLLTTREVIERSASMFLHGDKHTYIARTENPLQEFMCGCPLGYDNVHYNLIEYSKETKATAQYVKYSENGWMLVPTGNFLENVYDTSKPYLKRLSAKFLISNNSIPSNWDDALRMFQNSVDDGRFDIVSKLFSSCCTLYNERHEKVRIDDNLFNLFYSHIVNSNQFRVISVKGDPGAGKSTFLTIEYLYMLHMYQCGECNMVPFYFDFDKLNFQIEQEVKENESYSISDILDLAYSKFKDFLDTCLNIVQRYNMNTCIFIDGLDTKNVFVDMGLTLEGRVYELLELTLQQSDNKLVMGLNTHENLKHEDSFHAVNRFQNVLFFNKVHIVPYKTPRRYDDFISAFLRLKGCTNEYSKIYSFLLKLRQVAIDLHFLYSNETLLNVIEDDTDLWIAMKKQVEQMIDHVDKLFCNPNTEKRRILYQTAFQMIFNCKTYQFISNNIGSDKLLYTDFIKMRNAPEVAMFLVANHYVEELKHYSQANEKIQDDSILWRFITRDLAVLIRLLSDKLHIRIDVYESFITKHQEELHCHLKSMLIYLLGHSSHEEKVELIKAISSANDETTIFFQLCNRRSTDLGLIVSQDNHDLANRFICSLIDDATYRLFNREYLLRYYCDKPVSQKRGHMFWDYDSVQTKGFDFHNCFLTLVSKMDYCFSNDMPYPMLEIDLFSICDLIYSRLQRKNTNQALFYSAAYNCVESPIATSVLRRTIKLLSDYAQRYGHGEQSRGLNQRISTYFTYVQTQFERITSELEKSIGHNVVEPFVSQALDYRKVIELCNKPRVGWNIAKSGPISKKLQPKYSRPNVVGFPKVSWGKSMPVHETIGQHILECLYIAQFFLPDSIGIEGYSKSTVMSMLLMSEVGKITIGDYTPTYTNAKSDYEPTEKRCRQEVLTLCAFDGYANLGHLFFTLMGFDTAIDQYPDINMTICQEIKLIQMEYKYYTLYKELPFEEKRRQVFKDEFIELHTPICQEIRKMLIRENTAFSEYFRH